MGRGGFLKEYYKVFCSNYYRHMLYANDKLVFSELCRVVLHTDKVNKYVEKYRLLYCNIKIKTLANNIGISVSSVKRSLHNLDRLGVIIKDPTERRKRGKLIFLGYALDENASDRRYLLEHLVNKFGPILNKNIEDRRKSGDNNPIKITDREFFRLDPDYKYFLSDNIFKPDLIANKPLKDGKTIYELLFNEIPIPHQKFAQNQSKIFLTGRELIDDKS